jgi:phenylacetate-coenzyme A ligase PaaK-like adenylate-forming protein
MPLLDPFELPPSLTRPEKLPFLLAGLADLTEHHRRGSEIYRRMIDVIFGEAAVPEDLADLPWLPVRLFKRMDLASVPRESIVKTLASSGTTGQAVSRIYLDAETAALQSKALSRIGMEFLGRKRLPMVIIDNSAFLRDRASLNARAAGILGFSTFGRDHFYALDENLQVDWSSLELYMAKHAPSPFLLFGFTFIVWQQFIESARSAGVTFRFPAESVLVHGGGWKRLADRQINNNEFKAAMAERFGIARSHNYYGMVEQIGSVFFECEDGYLHAPGFADVLMRNPITLEPLQIGHEGLIQVFSLLPRSYPGHSLLTEDLGTIHGEDDCRCGRSGKRFTVSGRLKNVEIRGCSDTRAVPLQ